MEAALIIPVIIAIVVAVVIIVVIHRPSIGSIALQWPSIPRFFEDKPLALKMPRDEKNI